MAVVIATIGLLCLGAAMVMLARNVMALEARVNRLARQSEDQATLINEQAQLIVRIASELRR